MTSLGGGSDSAIIMPMIKLPSLAPGIDSARAWWHQSDVLLSPAKFEPLIWGVGPTFTLPTATDSLLGPAMLTM